MYLALGDTFLRTGKQIYYMTFKLMIFSYLKPKTIYKCTGLQIYTGHSSYKTNDPIVSNVSALVPTLSLDLLCIT